jgi:hypothetical protein
MEIASETGAPVMRHDVGASDNVNQGGEHDA